MNPDDLASAKERSSEIETRRVSTTAGFFDSLRADAMHVRLATLKAISQTPEKALLFGRYQERDVIDELIYQLTVSQDPSYRGALFAALVVFEDPRVVRCARNIFSSEKEPFLVIAAVKRLRLEPEAVLVPFFTPFLFDAPSQLNAREAGRVLGGCQSIDDIAINLRAALLAADETISPPLMNQETSSFWLTELNGPLAETARGFLFTQGKRALKTLKDHWGLLDDPNRIWLVSWVAQQFPAEGVGLVLRALEDISEAVMIAALNAIPTYGECQHLFENVLEGIELTDSSEEFVCAAIRAGVPVDHHWEMLFAKGKLSVKIALVERLAYVDSPDSADRLFACLDEDHWRIRSSARDALKRRGDIPADRLINMGKAGSPRLKTAIVQILMQLDRDDWTDEWLKPISKKT